MSKTRVVLALITTAGLVVDQPRLAQVQEGYSLLSINREKREQDRIETKLEVETLAQESKRAMDIFRTGCTEMVDKNKQPTVFTETTTAWNYPETVKTNTGLQRTILDKGTIVCNRLGETAVVGEGGKYTRIARVGTQDREEFQKLKPKIFGK